MKRIYVGNLPKGTREDDLWRVFERYGKVLTVDLATRRGTGQFLGYGFVEMEEADKAIVALHNAFVGGRYLTVHQALPRELEPEKPSRR